MTQPLASLPAQSGFAHPSGFLPRAPFQDIITDGSTEGILIAGVILLLIILVPIAWTRRRWNG